jgi:hypothetical protein
MRRLTYKQNNNVDSHSQARPENYTPKKMRKCHTIKCGLWRDACSGWDDFSTSLSLSQTLHFYSLAEWVSRWTISDILWV